MAQISFTGVDGDTDPERLRQAPLLPHQRKLNRARRAYSIRGTGENSEATITFATWRDQLATVPSDEVLDQFIVARQRCAPRV